MSVCAELQLAVLKRTIADWKNAGKVAFAYTEADGESWRDFRVSKDEILDFINSEAFSLYCPWEIDVEHCRKAFINNLNSLHRFPNDYR